MNGNWKQDFFVYIFLQPDAVCTMRRDYRWLKILQFQIEAFVHLFESFHSFAWATWCSAGQNRMPKRGVTWIAEKQVLVSLTAIKNRLCKKRFPSRYRSPKKEEAALTSSTCLCQISNFKNIANLMINEKSRRRSTKLCWGSFLWPLNRYRVERRNLLTRASVYRVWSKKQQT